MHVIYQYHLDNISKIHNGVCQDSCGLYVKRSCYCKSRKNVQNFVNVTFEFSMIATINKPTRVTSSTATAIHNIITNSIFDNDFESAIIKIDVSVYFPIIFITKL